MTDERLLSEQVANYYDFTGRTALVTGGTGTLGGEMATALVGLGASVAILTHSRDIPQEMQERIRRASRSRAPRSARIA